MHVQIIGYIEFNMIIKALKMKKQITYQALLLALMLLFSCSDNDENIEISAIQVTNTLSVGIEEAGSLEVTILPENTTEKAIFNWRSSDESVATIDEKGAIKALKTGETTITVELTRNPKIFSECTVTVSEQSVKLDPNTVIEFEDPILAALILRHDTNNDGKLQYSEALEIKQLLVRFISIKSLKGLEYLENLVTLAAQGNDLVHVDLTANKHLQYVYLHDNILESVNISGLDALEELNCSSNRLSSIDVTTNSNLKMLDVSLNHEGRGNSGLGITQLDVSKNTKLEKLNLHYTNVSTLDLSKNTKLKWIDFGLSSYTSPSTDPITQIDFSNNLELEHIACDAIVRTVDMDGHLINDKVGLSKIDVTMLPHLKFLNFNGNSIKDIDLSKNIELTQLNCSRNYLKELDITNNHKLDRLICELNQLAELDLSNSHSLTYLNCAYNQIGKLDISKTIMSHLLANNNQITSFSLGEKVFDTPEGKDNKPYLYLKLNDNKIPSIDVSKQVNLAWLEINNNELTGLDISNCPYLGGVLLNNNKVKTLNVLKISRIWEIQAQNNQLSGDIDFSHLSLSRLYIDGNPGLRQIKVWSNFNENCTGFHADHTAGTSGTKKCYTKDNTASWVK